MSCSMQKKIESFRKISETSYGAGSKFYDSFVKSRAKEILEDYDVNDTQGGSCDAWYEIGNGVEDIERDSRDGFWSWNDGGVEKTWTTTSFMIMGQGCTDDKIDKDYDRLEDICQDEYKDQCKENGTECDLESEDFYDFEERWWEEGAEIFARVTIMLYSRDSDEGKYTLLCRVGRSFDYTYGRNFDDDLYINMDLTTEQLTEANANKFLDAVEKQLKEYAFSDGEKTIEIQAD